jgi:glycerate kinase
MRILVAPDKFKGSFSGEQVAERIAAGLKSVLPQAEIEIAPVADGGEGTADILSRALGGEQVECEACDALGRKIRGRYDWVSDSATAIMEMSAVSGLATLSPNERNPRRASTFGVGQMLRDATTRGAHEVILGLGGSATNDGGSGMARALGFRFLDENDTEISAAEELQNLARIESPNELRLPAIRAATDVRNPLLGPDGATHTFARQKGATPADVEILEKALTRLADVAATTFGGDQRDAVGAGAAGGLGFGLLVFCRATLHPGFELVAEAIDLQKKIARADFVITGEGRLDRQTLSGKAPAGVARMARTAGKPVFAIVGESRDEEATRHLFDDILPLGHEALETRAGELARRLSTRFGNR